MSVFARIGFATLVLVLQIFAAEPLRAPRLAPDGAPNPDASVLDQRTLLQQAPRIEGRIDIPDLKASVLIQPRGRTWDYFHEVLLHWGGAMVLLGTIALLSLAYLIIGRLRIAAGRAGKTITRFVAFERFSHWLTAVSFLVLAVTGLNVTFGKILLLPIIGPEAFSEVSQIAKYTHNFVSFAFMVGLTLLGLIFFRDNLPSTVDIEWVRKGGGFIKSKHAPAGRFNLGEKLVYWLSVAAGAAVSVSGLVLLFPFYGTNVADMQLAHVAHAVIAVLFISLILAHIYIGTLGMEGAFEAMATGEVDLNWAREHHDQWLAERLERAKQSPASPSE